MISNNIVENNNRYNVSNRRIIDENGIIIYNLKGLPNVEKGVIEIVDNKVYYKLKINDKCFVKNIDQKNNVIENKCTY